MKFYLSLISLVLFLMLGCKESKFQNGSKPENKGNNVENPNFTNECEKGKEEAEKDFNNDELGLYFYGLPNPRFNNWVRLMRKEYELGIKGGGDIIDEQGDCYNKIMRDKIKFKFGDDAFKRIDNKLDSLYKLGLGDREPEFVGGQSELIKYFYCNIEDELLSNNENIPMVVIQISINRNGNVQNKGIVFQNSYAKEDDKYQKKANHLIEQMPNWIPAIEKEEKVNFENFNIPI